MLTALWRLCKSNGGGVEPFAVFTMEQRRGQIGVAMPKAVWRSRSAGTWQGRGTFRGVLRELEGT